MPACFTNLLCSSLLSFTSTSFNRVLFASLLRCVAAPVPGATLNRQFGEGCPGLTNTWDLQEEAISTAILAQVVELFSGVRFPHLPVFHRLADAAATSSRWLTELNQNSRSPLQAEHWWCGIAGLRSMYPTAAGALTESVLLGLGHPVVRDLVHRGMAMRAFA